MRAGGTVGFLRLQGEDMLEAPPIADTEREYAFRYSLDTFPANLYLNAGYAVPLFPVAGHLPAKPLGLDLGEAEVFGRRVPVPLNLNREHWHGLAYTARAEIMSVEPTRAHLRLREGFFGPYWTGLVQFDLRYQLGATFRCEMTALNIGPTPVPAGMGVKLTLRDPGGATELERLAGGVRLGAVTITASPLAQVDTAGGMVLSEAMRGLEPDASLRFAYEISYDPKLSAPESPA